jgi:methyl-accepting chemotaxis protein
MRLSNWKIRYKLLLLVGVMALLIAVVSGVGLFAIRDIANQQQIMDENDAEALLSASLNQNVIALNRAEYRIGGDPSADTLNEVLNMVSAEKKMIEDRLAKLRATANGEQVGMLKAIENDYKAYLAKFEDTVGKVRQLGTSVSLSDAQRTIEEAVKSSQAAADKLQQTVKTYSDNAGSNSDDATANANKTASALQLVMVIVSTLGIVGGIVLGYLLATFGISRPLAKSVTNLNQLAKGDLSTQIFGAERKDEIGEIASALDVFKQNSLEVRRLQEEQKLQEQRAAEEKRRAMHELAERFESSVGGIVKMIAAAATEMRSTAESMSATAEETSRQSTAVAAASRPWHQRRRSSPARSPKSAGAYRNRAISLVAPSRRLRGPTPRSRVWPRRPTRSATLCNSSTTLPARPIFWRSTPRSRRRARARRGRVSRWWPPRSSRSRTRRPRRPRR